MITKDLDLRRCRSSGMLSAPSKDLIRTSNNGIIGSQGCRVGWMSAHTEHIVQ